MAISIPSDTNGRANGMSRIPAPVAKLTTVESTGLEEAIEAGVQYQYNHETFPINLTYIKRKANIDDQNQSLFETIEQDFPEFKELLLILFREFWNFRNDLFVINTQVFKEGRVLISKNT